METAQSESAGRLLADLVPAMEVEGVVTRTELFGAFVDIGAEREGLIHISMLKPGHVNRVEDVVQAGSKVRCWVHRVDPAAGRLELTLIQPVLLKWKDIVPGLKVRGKVVRLERFGAFIDIGAERPGLVHVSEMSADYVSNPADIVRVGDEVSVVIVDADRKKRQIRLSMKEAIEKVELPEDETKERVPTAMELALRQALDDTQPTPLSEAPRPRTGRRAVDRTDQEEILARTLKQRVRTASSED